MNVSLKHADENLGMRKHYTGRLVRGLENRLNVVDFYGKTIERVRAQRRVKARTRQLHLPSPLTLEVLFEYVEEVTGRPLLIERRDELIGKGVTGFWHELTEGDEVLANEIFHAGSEEDPRGRFNILHEVAHILMGHEPEPLTKEDLSAGYPDLDPDKIYIGRCRDQVRTGPEAEAEILADLLYDRILVDANQDRELLHFHQVLG